MWRKLILVLVVLPERTRQVRRQAERALAIEVGRQRAADAVVDDRLLADGGANDFVSQSSQQPDQAIEFGQQARDALVSLRGLRLVVLLAALALMEFIGAGFSSVVLSLWRRFRLSPRTTRPMIFSAP